MKPKLNFFLVRVPQWSEEYECVYYKHLLFYGKISKAKFKADSKALNSKIDGSFLSNRQEISLYNDHYLSLGYNKCKNFIEA